MHKDVDAESGDVAQVEGEVALPVFFEILPLRVTHHVVDKRVSFILGQGRVVELLEIAMQADHRWFTGADVAVRGALLDAKGQQFGDINHRITPCSERMYG